MGNSVTLLEDSAVLGGADVDTLSIPPGSLCDYGPLGFDAGDANLYRYVGNDPIDEVDPTGDKGKKTDDINNPPPNTPVKPKGPSDLPPTLPGKWKIYLRASSDHAWLVYVNYDTGEKHTFGRYLNGWGGVENPGHPDPNDPEHWLVPPAAIAGTQMDQDLLKESGDPDKPKPGVASRGPITRENPQIYGSPGYNAINNNCASYARNVWYQYTGEWFSTQNPIWYSPGGLAGSINAQNAEDNSPNLPVTPGNGYYLP